jgi:hypothetical protein
MKMIRFRRRDAYDSSSNHPMGCAQIGARSLHFSPHLPASKPASFEHFGIRQNQL